MRSKRCYKCGAVKPESRFSKDRAARDGLQSWCKGCKGSRYEAHREEIRDRARDYYEVYREEINAHHRAYRESHRDEFLAIRRKWEAETQSAAREVATRNGESWTPAEDHVVLASGGTMLEIAIELGRTTSSVRNRRMFLRRKAVTA